MNKSVNIAIDFLLREQQKGYSEAKHLLAFPRPGLFGVKIEKHGTVFFQRLLILDALLDAKKGSYKIPYDIIEEEIQQIIQSRHPNLVSGWSYFPQLDDFPPDADDLGAVLHVASRISDNKLNEFCDKAVRAALQSAVHGDGSIDTWILDNNNHSIAAQKVKKCVDIIGGKGVHPEVVANFFEGLSKYNHKKFKNQIEKGIQYLLTLQHPEGYWPAKWYWGKVYSTLKVMGAITQVSNANDALSKARAYLLNQQHPDGSWGKRQGDPLNTSFGILALSKTKKLGEAKDAILKAIRYLIATQQKDGSWDSVPLIRMDSQNGILSYGSRTVSTSFVLKALMTTRKRIYL